tara:strand:- start:1191 stop:1427 length:237 start_codon:yes stop_codon:yes gene_type:complete
MITGIFKIINLRVFLLSLFLGLIFIYLNDDRKKINVYPTPSNINKVEYKDRAENCYEYTMEQVKCPSKSSQINHVPVQ